MANKGSVLVVDDEQFIRTTLAQILERNGYEVREAVDGKDALTKLSEHSADFVITDIKMPNVDGMELLVEIKKKYPGVGVAMITGFSGSYKPEELIANGADHYILKPFKADQIRRALNEMKERRD